MMKKWLPLLVALLLPLASGCQPVHSHRLRRQACMGDSVA